MIVTRNRLVWLLRPPQQRGLGIDKFWWGARRYPGKQNILGPPVILGTRLAELSLLRTDTRTDTFFADTR